MDILGVGPLELLFIFLIALIFLGPNDMVKAGRTLGKTMRKVVTSDAWREITRLRTLPNQLMREAGLEDELKDLKEIQKELPKALEIDTPVLPENSPPEANPSSGDGSADLSDWTAPQADKSPAAEAMGEVAPPTVQEGEKPDGASSEAEPKPSGP